MKNAGIVLVIIGILALLSGFGLQINICGVFFALIFLWIGLRLLLVTGGAVSPEDTKRKAFVIPTEGGTSAAYEINHGMGKLKIGATQLEDVAVEGLCTGEVEPTAELRKGEVRVKIGAIESAWVKVIMPWQWHAFNWDLGLNPDLPTKLEIGTGASEVDIDLADLTITTFKLGFGGAQANVVMPRLGRTEAKIETGASSLTVTIPEGVAARIKEEGFGGFTVDRVRFPRVKDGVFESPDYDTAVNRVELTVEYGMASISIR